MRRLAALLSLCLALAAPAAAQQGRITPDVTAPALRGAIQAPAPRSDLERVSLIPAPLPATSLAVSTGESRQCRLGCSRDYYFCLASEDDQCPQRWSRCVAGCAG